MRHSMRPLIYIVLYGTMLVIILATATAVLVHREMSLLLSVDADALFDIPRGAHLNQVTQALSQAELLSANPLLFQAYARATRYRGVIQAGEYKISSGMDSYALLKRFRAGEVYHYNITFPEGWHLSAWRAALKDTAELQHEGGHLSDTELATALGIEGAPEGWFYPDTYSFVKGSRDLAILHRAHVKMKQLLAREWAHPSPSSGLSDGARESLSDPYAVLILASMIEKETGYEPDRAIIASVFHNRLRRGMRLQSDPTVIYGLAETYAGNLTRRHIDTDGPFNTYTRSGLPPTPICSPGPASIKAALSPATSDYLYFVAKGNGESHFSSTLDEHILAVRRYQQTNRQKSDRPQ